MCTRWMPVRIVVVLALAVMALTAGAGECAAAETATGGKKAQSDLETIKTRILGSLLERAGDDAAKLVGTLRADGSWPDIDYRNRRRSGWPLLRHLANVQVLARAYRSPKSQLRGKGKLRRAVLSSLDYWLNNDFQNPNWWHNQIGVPRTLAPTLLLMEADLSARQLGAGLKILRRAKIRMTGQNLVWLTEITARRGILEKDPALVAAAYRRIAQEIRVGAAEGVQADFSFHQHGPCLYNHGYGAAFAVDCSRIATDVAGTRLAFPREKVAVLSGLILDGSQWMARGGASDFGADGRGITRKRRGHTAAYLAAAAKHMLRLPTGREAEFRALAASASGTGAPALKGNRHFWRSDMMTHHRAGYYASARMFSRRIANTDQPCNSEGLKSHHIADGCNPIMRTGREYSGIFGVWDWRKIPGTTVRQAGELAGSPRRTGERSFVGGVSDGTYGLAAFDFAREGLSARKIWFFLDDEFVCLGAGITCRSSEAVVTTLNQCNLTGDVLVGSGKQSRKLARGTHSLDSPAWIWHDRIAYVPLAPARIRLSNDVQRGSWWRINHQYPKEEIARAVFLSYIDHGPAPKSASYAYAVVPGIDHASAGVYAARPPVKILRNSPALQAVRHEKLKIAAMAFYKAGGVEIRPGLTVAVDTPCLVLLRELGGKLAISVSNPANKKAAVGVIVSGKLQGEGVRVLAGGAKTRLVVDLPDGMTAGSTVTRTLLRP